MQVGLAASIATLVLFGKELAVALYHLALTREGIAMIAAGGGVFALCIGVLVSILFIRK
jgi:hypothetical protein